MVIFILLRMLNLILPQFFFKVKSVEFESIVRDVVTHLP